MLALSMLNFANIGYNRAKIKRREHIGSNKQCFIHF